MKPSGVIIPPPLGVPAGAYLCQGIKESGKQAMLNWE